MRVVTKVAYALPLASTYLSNYVREGTSVRRFVSLSFGQSASQLVSQWVGQLVSRSVTH